MGVNSCGTTMLDQGAFVGLASIDWDTTPKTADFTAVSGNGYFVNTTSTAITVTLPAGSIGDILGFSDYASTFNTNAITISPNGTDKINGINDEVVISTKGICFSLIYVDSTQGWKAIESNSVDPTAASFITATGGTITTSGDYKIHTFTGPGTFTVTCLGQPTNTVEYLVVAGGASGGGNRGGGGGAGGLRHNFPSPVTGGQPVSVQGYPISVGGGGAAITGDGKGNPGSSSSGFGITSAGGGGGGYANPSTPNRTGIAGGSGGGGSGGPGNGGPGPGAVGNTPPVSPPQGNSGGNGAGPAPSLNEGGGGGGGASTAGADAIYPSPNTHAGDGGDGIQIPEVPASYGSPAQYFGGGGGGGVDCRSSPPTGSEVGSGGLGGGSRGAGFNTTPLAVSPDAVANTGGGSGGGGLFCSGSGSGGSGIVIIRYKFQ
jgi:hypothetical protein